MQTSFRILPRCRMQLDRLRALHEPSSLNDYLQSLVMNPYFDKAVLPEIEADRFTDADTFELRKPRTITMNDGAMVRLYHMANVLAPITGAGTGKPNIARTLRFLIASAYARGIPDWSAAREMISARTRARRL